MKCQPGTSGRNLAAECEPDTPLLESTSFTGQERLVTGLVSGLYAVVPVFSVVGGVVGGYVGYTLYKRQREKNSYQQPE